jgi:hypothetical protein
MYSKKTQETDCPVFGTRIHLEIVYEVSGTGTCQILANVVSVSCSSEGACDRVLSEKCLVNPEVLKDYTL